MSGPRQNQTDPVNSKERGESSESDVSTRIESLNDCIKQLEEFLSSLRQEKESGDSSDSDVSTKIDSFMDSLEQLQEFLSSLKSSDSSVSIRSDSKKYVTDFKRKHSSLRVDGSKKSPADFKQRHSSLRSVDSVRSCDSGVSFRSNQSKDSLPYFKGSLSSLRSVNTVRSDDFDVSFRSDESRDDVIDLKQRQPSLIKMKETGESSDSDVSTKIDFLMGRMEQMEELLISFSLSTTRREDSVRSYDSGVSFRSDGSKKCVSDSKGKHSSLRSVDSVRSCDSGVSFRSDKSKDDLTYFKGSLSSLRSDISSLLKDLDVADDLVESSDDQAGQRNVEQEVPPDPQRTSEDSVESSDSAVSMKTDLSPRQQHDAAKRKWRHAKEIFP
ncbi:uncharacterized protein LOC131988573 isoform X1 [Centropristis striata]|uniref:uncharacterized protein LOC131988573 isoform X1 n=1 Tax=Centropristis striata TaxID=184440 RepID=UPI0027E0EF5E|nr:uncharacterized protein LOC131988573 isoform X1 [Centropristis striata]